MLAALIAFHVAFASPTPDADSVIREMAKNTSSIYILYGGDVGKGIARSLMRDIQDNRDWKDDKRKSIKVVDPTEAGSLVSTGKIDRETLIVVQIGADPIQAADQVIDTFRVPEPTKTGNTHVRVHTIRPSAGQQSFSIIISAPDEKRAQMGLTDLESSTGPGYRDLDFDHDFKSNFALIHSNVDLTAWGESADPFTWNFVNHVSLSDQPFDPTKQDETVQIYAIDRSQSADGIPPALEAGLKNLNLKEDEIFSGYVACQGTRVGVITAPNKDLLLGALSGYRTAADLPSIPARTEARDLRFLTGDKGECVVLLDMSDSMKGDPKSVTLRRDFEGELNSMAFMFPLAELVKPLWMRSTFSV